MSHINQVGFCRPVLGKEATHGGRCEGRWYRIRSTVHLELEAMELGLRGGYVANLPRLHFSPAYASGTDGLTNGAPQPMMVYKFERDPSVYKVRDCYESTCPALHFAVSSGIGPLQ